MKVSLTAMEMIQDKEILLAFNLQSAKQSLRLGNFV